ncbi:40S ribosomal protein s13 [Kalaharituber pfeilii]|nr:40S ribosomal protein s13 [Kalaharituber pfeilii]
MVFIGGINVPEIHLVKQVLQGFYGVGPNVAGKLMSKLSIHPTAVVGSLSTAKTMAITMELSKMTIENDLRRKIQQDIRRLRDMGTYRGRRHAMSLPVRGQNTRSQINTARKLNKVERWS